jgi:hypothetical protein
LADPITELTVFATPPALQSGAADAVGAAITDAATPASRPQPAVYRSMLLPLKFIIDCFLRDED